MPNPVTTGLVRYLKPAVSESTWARLRALGGRSEAAGAPARAVAEPSRADRLRAMGLDELAVEFGSDKNAVHRYTPHYERHLQHLRDRRFTLLEIGIGGYANQWGGASLRMWKHFFPKAQVLGLDIHDKSFVDEPRIKTILGSQVDEDLLRRVVEEEGPIKVVIDDGSHRPEHVRETFRILFPLLAPHGIYVIEDIQTSYWPEWGGSEDRHDRGTSMALVKDLLDGLNHKEFVDEAYEPSYSDRHVVALHAYHNLIVIEKGKNNGPTNKRRVLKERYAARPAPSSEAEEGGQQATGQPDAADPHRPD